MATEKISSRLVGMINTQDEQNLRILLNAAQADMALLRSELNALRTSFVALTAKMDADAFGDTDYASTCDPAAFTASLTFTQ